MCFSNTQTQPSGRTGDSQPSSKLDKLKVWKDSGEGERKNVSATLEIHTNVSFLDTSVFCSLFKPFIFSAAFVL